MTDDFELDPREQELRRRFDTLAATPDDPDAVLDSMRPRLRRAQRNHRLATSAVATLVLVGAVVVGLAAFRGSDTGSVRITPPAGSTPSAPTSTTTPSDPTTPTVSTPTGPDSTVPTGTAPTGGTLPEPTGTTPTGGTTPATTPEPGPTTVPVISDTPVRVGGRLDRGPPIGPGDLTGLEHPAAGYTQEVHDNGPTGGGGLRQRGHRVANSRRARERRARRRDDATLKSGRPRVYDDVGTSVYATTCHRELRRTSWTRLRMTVPSWRPTRVVTNATSLPDVTVTSSIATCSTSPRSRVAARTRRVWRPRRPAGRDRRAAPPPRGSRARRSRGGPTPARRTPRPHPGQVRCRGRSR